MAESNSSRTEPNAVDSDLSGPHGHVQEHIDLIAKHEQDFLAKRTQSEKIGDKMASLIGSLSYVAAHVLLFTGWILWNTSPPVAAKHFDPFPFPLLSFLFTFEAILVAAFILMRQTRMSRRSEEREHLMLQILLLTEREITAVLGIDQQIAARVGLHKVASNEEINQLSQQTSIDEVAQVIKDSLPSE